MTSRKERGEGNVGLTLTSFELVLPPLDRRVDDRRVSQTEDGDSVERDEGEDESVDRFGHHGCLLG